ncbi:MAG TPA: RNA methyltransferase [Polyangia bacterium]|nr:RNA methyltransferase [Polyangia bacterium]
MNPFLPVDDPDDPRLADYRHTRDRDLASEGDRFVAESELVVRRLLASRLTTHSVLATPTRLATLADALARVTCPVYVATQAVLDAIAGFHVHRGCLAIGQRPADARVPEAARTVLVLEDLVSADNLGASARNAAAFGVDALVLSPRCADPFYRKAVRVSIGAVCDLPVVTCARWPEDLLALKAAGFRLYGAVLDERAIPLPAVRRSEKAALLLGTEGPGLSAAARAACDQLITIPMAPGADSLNVATAGAVALYHLQQAAPLA